MSAQAISSSVSAHKSGVDLRVCAKCRHLGVREWIASVREHELRVRKEVSSVALSVWRSSG